MPKRIGREVSVGVVVALGLVVFAVAVLAVSQESRMFRPKTRYWSRFDNTSGLAVGSPVRLVGVQVGTVEEIEFPTDPRENKIRVGFKIDRAFAPRIRIGTVAYLKSLSYLSQDKYLELTPGDPDQPALESGEYIEAGVSAWETTLMQSQSIADDVKEITSSLRDVLVAINRGDGIMHEVIHDPEFGRAGKADLEGSLASMRRILEGIEKGKGLAGGLVGNNEYSRREMEKIDAALTHLNSALEKVDNPEGPLAQLTDPKGKGAAMIDDLHKGAAAFSRTATQLSEGKGLVGRLINDQEYADALLKKMKSAVSHADSILGKIDRGEGTVGGIINDPEVYESLKDIVAGIQKSRIGKGMIRHYGKKGAEARPEGEEEEPPPPPQPNP